MPELIRTWNPLSMISPKDTSSSLSILRVTGHPSSAAPPSSKRTREERSQETTEATACARTRLGHSLIPSLVIRSMTHFAVYSRLFGVDPVHTHPMCCTSTLYCVGQLLPTGTFQTLRETATNRSPEQLGSGATAATTRHTARPSHDSRSAPPSLARRCYALPLRGPRASAPLR